MNDMSSQPVQERRAAQRHDVEYPVIVEHIKHGEFESTVVNISAHGFMLRGSGDLQRGDRIMVRLPVAGYIEAHLVWAIDDRAGFQFERIIRMSDFLQLLEKMGAED